MKWHDSGELHGHVQVLNLYKGHKVVTEFLSNFARLRLLNFISIFHFFPLKMGFIIYFLWQWKCSFVTLTSTFQISNWFFTTSLRWKDLYGNTRWVCYKKQIMNERHMLWFAISSLTTKINFPLSYRQLYRICMYTTSSCDFAAIEITESVSNECVISLEKRGHCTYIYLTSHNIAILNKVIASFFFV